MGIFNSRRTEHKNPSGAVASQTQVRFFLACGDDQGTLVIYRDGELQPLRVEMRRTDGGLQAEHCFADAGLYFYYFELGEQDAVVRDDFGEGVRRGWRSDPVLFQQTVYDASYHLVCGFAGGVMYQIFPDRFNVGSNGQLGREDLNRQFHDDLRDVPVWWPNEQGMITNTDFFGGNLRGVQEKLDYLVSLGVTCIYFNPICEAHSNHRYDTADYMKVDPVLGDERDFKRLCEAAHERGIRIVLDGVFSHTGADSVYFNKYGRYPGLGAYQGRESPYYKWYKFGRYADEYASWWGFDTLPEVNEQEESFAQFICGEDGVIAHWMALGADGFRLDVADELPDSFIERIRAAVKRWGNDKILIGEVWEDASTKVSYGERRRYLWGKELDAVMNYPFRTAVLDFVRTANAAEFMRRVTEICENYPPPMLNVMMNMLATHDTARALNALAVGEEYRGKSREWQAGNALSDGDYLRAVEMLKLACALQFTLPGLPCIYYGDEIGMQGYGDPFCRGYMRWDMPDKLLCDEIRSISGFRAKNRDVLADGRLVPLRSDGGVVAYLRENTRGQVLTAVNRGELMTDIALPDGDSVSIAPWSYLLLRL